MKTLQFINPANGFVIKIEAPFIMCFLLGPLYIGLKGAWGPAVGYFLLSCVTVGVFWMILPFMAEGIFRNHYMGLGWKEVSTTRPGDDTDGMNGVMGWILGALALATLGLITLLLLCQHWTHR
jgi:hypothetical protein